MSAHRIGDDSCVHSPWLVGVPVNKPINAKRVSDDAGLHSDLLVRDLVSNSVNANRIGDDPRLLSGLPGHDLMSINQCECNMLVPFSRLYPGLFVDVA